MRRPLYNCDRHAVLLIQYTGFLDSINAIRALAVEYRLLVMMIVGLQVLEDGRPPSASDKLGMRIMEPIMQAMQTRVNRHLIFTMNTARNQRRTTKQPYATLNTHSKKLHD